MTQEFDVSKIDFTKSSSEDLAAHVVVYKALKIRKEVALACMKELAKRRDQGDSFDYEGYIEKEVAKIPKISESADFKQVTNSIFKTMAGITGIGAKK